MAASSFQFVVPLGIFDAAKETEFSNGFHDIAAIQAPAEILQGFRIAQ